MSPSDTRLAQLILALFLTFAWDSITAQESASALYERARGSAASGEREAALSDLRQALQQDDQHLPSLLLLGDLLLESGDLTVATEVLSESLLLGADPNYVAPKLADALLLLGEYRRLIDEIRPGTVTGTARADLLGLRSIAYRALDNASLAEESLQQALQIAPDARVPLRLLAERALREDRVDDALDLSRRLVTQYPNEHNAWTLRGSVLAAADSPDAAIAAFDRALALNELSAQARLGRIALYLAAEDLASARSDAQFMLSALPSDPRGSFLRAQIHELDNQDEAAMEQYRRTVDLAGALPQEQVAGNQQLTTLFAAAAARVGARARAREVLSAYQARHPRDASTGAMLARLQAEAGDGLAALETLKPLLADDPESLALRAVQAEALSSRGEHRQAIAAWEAIREESGDSVTISSSIARELIAAGDVADGVALLQDLVDREPDRATDLELLAQTLLDIGEAPRALDYAEQLLATAPENPKYRAARALALLRNDRLAEATEELQALLREYPDNGDIAAGLVEADLRAGEYALARQKLLRFEARHPDDDALALQRAQVERLLGNTEEARRYAQRARDLAPTSLDAARELIGQHLAADEADAAVDVAGAVARRRRTDLPSAFLLAETFTATGQRQQAAAQYTLIARREEAGHADLYRAANAQAKLGRFEDASATLFKAIREKPDSLTYRGALIDTKLALGQAAAALSDAQALAEEFPRSAAAWWLLGRAHGANADPARAEDAFDQALALDPEHRPALLGYQRALFAQGEYARAAQVLAAWVDRHADDVNAVLALAQAQRNSASIAAAADTLAAAAERLPQSAILLNALASTQHELGMDAALATARRAHGLAPDRPETNDTLGWVLASRGANQEALSLLRSAVARGGTPSRRYHLAVVLANLERYPEAVEELRRALRAAASFPERDAAARLLESSEKSLAARS